MSNAATALPTGWKIWLAGARPKTLPAAIVPVALGTATADVIGDVDLVRAVLALVVSLALQTGVNFANDYSDGVRGTDDVGLRVGPPRLVGWKLASPDAVKTAALTSFTLAAIAGLGLAAVTSWWLIVVGIVAIAAAWGYTGGPAPYAYIGLGELFVFVFFGLVAVTGTVYVQTSRIPTLAWWNGVVAGLLAVALLIINNLRDIPGDSVVGKKTLAVRLGDSRTRSLYVAVICVATVVGPLGASAIIGHLGPLLGLGSLVLVMGVVRLVRSGIAGRSLIPVLAKTGRVQLVCGALLSLGLLLSAHS